MSLTCGVELKLEQKALVKAFLQDRVQDVMDHANRLGFIVKVGTPGKGLVRMTSENVHFVCKNDKL